MRIAFLGFGLIGGSVARALSDRPVGDNLADTALVAWSRTGEGPRMAVAEGVLAEAAHDPSGAVDGADLVILAAPPLACLDLIDRLGSDLKPVLSPHATVTDVASTKASIVMRAQSAGLRFVGGHPMAGREATGYEASSADLFRDCPWVVVPASAGSDEEAVRRVETVARACGALPVRMDAEEHDAAVAAISHLPLVLAAALVEAVTRAPEGVARADWEIARSLAASGWRDMTRLARGDPEMAAGILATNARAVGDRLRDLQRVLDSWLAEAEGLSRMDQPGAAEAGPVWARFKAARDRLEGDGRP